MQPTASEITPCETMSERECDARIVAAKRALGDRLVILGHHFLRDEVFRHVDFSGDSLKLVRQVARSRADYIVCCGAHFMAEVADILSGPEQLAVLPDMAAGCSLADMAAPADVARAWRELGSVVDIDGAVVPVTSISSAAGLKAFCGARGGIVCTPGNARQVLDWALRQREKVMFFPDGQLGRNTAVDMGVAPEDLAVWDFARPMGGLSAAQLRAAKIILWKGYCAVHQVFRSADIERFKHVYPDAKLIAHPQAGLEVCQSADYVGSSDYIVEVVRAAPPDTRWLVATELNLVNRLRRSCAAQRKSVQFLSSALCMCSTLFRVDPQRLLWTLENLAAGRVVNPVKVPAEDAQPARIALTRMLKISP